ncbi:hypothetical protein RND71_030941 [Anisodus tanguticus]|uniref:Uncharacterized protein n=1 Tax=Anisodus tanguticus TaxID=243964 RepID=A0AAE1RHB8_9SOLA|nr:hypothetical protein RND71_030941 [Anisodus tanguticus]
MFDHRILNFIILKKNSVSQNFDPTWNRPGPDAMDCADEFLKFVCKRILESCTEDMQIVLKRIHKTVMGRLQLILSSSFEKISYAVAIEVLTQATWTKFERKIEWGDSLTEEHERYTRTS